MSSFFDQAFRGVDVAMGQTFGEAVVYTNLAGESVTDSKCFVDFNDSGYEVDGGIRQSQPPDGSDSGTSTDIKRSFSFRKSVIGESKPEIHAKVRVVSEGSNALVWSVWRIIGSDAHRWVLACERSELHERSRANMRSGGGR